MNVTDSREMDDSITWIIIRNTYMHLHSICEHIQIFSYKFPCSSCFLEGVATGASTGVSPSIVGAVGVTQKHRGVASTVNQGINNNNNNHHVAQAAHTTSSSSSAAAMKGQLSLNGTGAANPSGDHSQEELLRQLFPSWF